MTVALSQIRLLTNYSDMDHIIEAIRKPRTTAHRASEKGAMVTCSARELKKRRQA